MVCMRAAFHQDDRNHENDKSDEDNSDSYQQGVDKDHGNAGCKPQVPQTTGLEIPESSGASGGSLHGGASFKVEKAHSAG